ncbi:MAG: ABC transporter permease [bacterium]
MIKNYFKTALRKLRRNQSYAGINVLGLALGMTCCLLIFLIIQYELRFDRFHGKRDRIYRITTDERMNDKASETMGAPIPMAEALRSDFLNLEKVAITYYAYSGQFTITGSKQVVRRFQEDSGVAYVEPEFFEIFDFPWKVGEVKSLAEPNRVALTEALAQKFFGSEDPLGKTIHLDHNLELQVIGIVKNYPVHTDLPFTAFISWKTLPQTGVNMESWGNLTSNTNLYVLLPPSYPPSELQSGLPAFKNKYFPDATDANKRVHKLQALSDIHYDSNYGNYGQRTVSKPTLWGLALIGVFLLLTACINFINMATAQAVNRAKEVGVRKVLGAFRVQLVGQYLGETFLITLLGATLAVALTELSLPSLNGLLQLKLNFQPFKNPTVIVYLIMLVASVGLLAGLYPAFVLSRFVPALALKSKMNASLGGGLSLRRGLVLFQFVISQLLMIGTIIVTTQMDYFRMRDMGFDQDAMVLVPLPQNEAAKLQALRAQLVQNSVIKNVSFNFSSASSGNRWDTNLRHTLNGAEEPFTSDLKFADAEYIPIYALKLIAGRNYSVSDTVTELVVNEAFTQKLGLAPQDLIGKTFKLGRRPYLPVVGVVKDFNTTSLHEEIRPCLLAANRRAYQEISVKIDAMNIAEALLHIEKAWSTVFPEFVYDFEFLDQRLADFYQEEQKMSQLFRVFSGMAILIGCIGLFGLVSFMAAQRTKEIGVRKVLGASTGNILLLLSREFAVLITLAFAVAAPVAYFVMRRWLQNFAYRIDIGAEVFALALMFTLIIATLTIGFRALKAAAANPVEALRYE